MGEYLHQIESELMKTSGGGDPVIRHWQYIAGDVMKDHVFLESVDESTLVVRCDHPAFASYFRMHQKEVISRLEEMFPQYDIRKVRVMS